MKPRKERARRCARALDRVHHACELGEHAVASGTDESSVVEFDQSVDDFAVRGESAKSRRFILSHEAAVAVCIGVEHRGELAFHYPPLMTANDRDILPQRELCQLDISYSSPLSGWVRVV